MIIRGKAVKLGDNINTDIIIPGRYLVHTDPQVLAEHVLEGLDPMFSKKAKSGVIIVAGRNFGCGSSREQAPIALKHAGVKAIIAKSFARIFYRNSINIGLPVVELENVDAIVDGEYVEMDLAEGYVKCRSRILRFRRYPQMVMDILKSSGIVNYIRSRLGVN